MYCPNCASQNSDDGKFCRTCGANLSLVPQALTGELPERRSRRHRRNRAATRTPDLSHGVQKTFVGFGFLFIALILCLLGHYWAVWMLFPGFGALGKGIAEIVAAREAQGVMNRSGSIAAAPVPNTGPLAADTSRELMTPPPSVTESTTKLFDEADRSGR